MKNLEFNLEMPRIISNELMMDIAERVGEIVV